jgi:adenosylcobinamide-phosphate synthase
VGTSQLGGDEVDIESPLTHQAASSQPVDIAVFPSVASQQVALAAWHWVDYLPARASALAFAVVGNFEEVVDAWRQLMGADVWPSNDTLVRTAMRASLGTKDTARSEHLRSLVGLVWRTVVLMLLLIALLSLARLLG